MACSGGEARGGLALELDQLRTMVRELEAHVCRGSPAARELCGALASSVDRAIARFAGCTPEPAACLVNAENGSKGTTGRFKKRKGMSEVRRQVRVRSVQDVASLDDGLAWRKYGQKDILGAKYPRAYFRCTHRHTQGCHAAKQVQRADGDPLLFDVVYLDEHTCAAHRGGGARRPPSAEQQQQQPTAGQEQQQSSPPAAGTAGLHQCLEPMTPFSFPSSPAGTGSGAFSCCFPLASPASSECQISSGYDSGAAHGFEAAMDFEAQLDEWLLKPDITMEDSVPTENQSKNTRDCSSTKTATFWIAAIFWISKCTKEKSLKVLALHQSLINYS